MIAPDATALGARAEVMISELAGISTEPGRLVRLFLTPEHRRAADLVAGWMRAAGLTVSEDALGTMRGRFGDAKQRLLIGSHIDTVIDAGKYDGPLGVIAAILAAEPFARAKVELPFGIDVLAFGDEEGSRFPVTLTSSSACAGVFDSEELASPDANGVTVAEALRAYGKDPKDIAAAAYRSDEAAGYVEVHIEQGPVLESKGEPLGIVTGIVGQVRLRVIVTGEAGHAGTVPMNLRRDALAGAAECALAVERVAQSHPELVGTVGRFEAKPGAINVIPGEVMFTVDVRAPQDSLREDAVAQIRSEISAIGRKRALDPHVENLQHFGVTTCASRLIAQMERAVASQGFRVRRLPSGAGHDGMALGAITDICMLFVRCKGGISHSPLESITREDAHAGARVLLEFIQSYS